MGAQQPQKSINPNQQNTQARKSDEKILHHIKDAFRNCATNGILTKNQFNQALAVLQTLNFKRLRDTPLADRLFDVFDKGKNGYISEQQFSSGIKDVISDKNNAIQCIFLFLNKDTFRAYDIDGDNRISKKEFTQMIEQTWKTAFRILSEQIDPTMKLSTRDVEDWTVGKISLLNEQSSQVFNKYDSSKRGVQFSQQTQYLEFQSFRQFVLSSGITEIKAEIDYKSVVIPLMLTELQK